MQRRVGVERGQRRGADLRLLLGPHKRVLLAVRRIALIQLAAALRLEMRVAVRPRGRHATLTVSHAFPLLVARQLAAVLVRHKASSGAAHRGTRDARDLAAQVRGLGAQEQRVRRHRRVELPRQELAHGARRLDLAGRDGWQHCERAAEVIAHVVCVVVGAGARLVGRGALGCLGQLGRLIDGALKDVVARGGAEELAEEAHRLHAAVGVPAELLGGQHHRVHLLAAEPHAERVKQVAVGDDVIALEVGRGLRLHRLAGLRVYRHSVAKKVSRGDAACRIRRSLHRRQAARRLGLGRRGHQ
mmetsp:Transcript_37687/g.111566  ORF Transcript_37687/g.111566 Transcript_37687/m.111566 type:complete len:301 (+) Transcript_37687:641-1543(+)